MGEGSLEILAYVCKGYQVVELSVYESDKEDGKGWEVGPPVGGENYAERSYVLRVKMFEAPRSWRTFDNTLLTLEQDTRYGLAFSSVQGPDSKLHFTIADTTALGDRVLTGPDGDERVMTESEFVKSAEKECR